MDKRYILLLLQVLELEYKKRCEQSTWEGDRDLWAKWHDYITDMIKTINEGGIK